MTLSPITRSPGINRGIRTLTIACLTCLLLVPAFARTVKEKKQAALLQFQVAERLRDSLSAKPESRRTREDYQRVLDAYRSVYHTAPNSIKAEAAIFAVAELLDEQGRVLDDPKSFKDAIGQLDFLRREYPGSTYRARALYTMAQIYRDDLDDGAQAKATFQEFLKRYPQNSMAGRAQDEIDDIDARDRKEQVPAGKTPKADTTAKAAAQEKPVQSPAASEHHHAPLLTGVRHWSTPDYTRVAIDLEQEVNYETGRVPHPDRIFFDLHGAKVAPGLTGKSFEVDDGFLHKIRVAQYKPNLARVVLDVDDVAEYSAFLLPNPYRLIIDIHGRKAVAKAVKHPMPPVASAKNNVQVEVPDTVTRAPASTAKASVPESPNSAAEKPASDKTVEMASAEDSDTEDSTIDEKERTTGKLTTGPTVQAVAPRETGSRATSATRATARRLDQTAHAASPTSSGERSLIRALGLKIGKIVIDAGHGGHDTGTIGPNGLMEKDLVLEVALKLGKLLEDRMGAEVVYTRDDDTFIPLETRTAIANKEQADLFISIHANSSSDPSARGIETYYLNFTSSPDALEVAARENAVSEKSIHELQDLVKKIALKEKIGESREFALDVQKSLYNGLLVKSPGLHDRGVKKAPFIVLIGANMPSILAEISFVSNPTDERKLKTSEYRQRIAESLYKGISKYVSGLSGVKVASKLETDEHSAVSTQRSAPGHSGNSQ